MSLPVEHSYTADAIAKPRIAMVTCGLPCPDLSNAWCVDITVMMQTLQGLEICSH